MRKNHLLALLALVFCFPHKALADESVFDRVIKTRTINCGYSIGAPYVEKDPNTGKLSGINYDIMEDIGKALGLKINWVEETGIGDVVAGLDSNRFDVYCATLWPDPGRMQTMSYTSPLFFTPVHAYKTDRDDVADVKTSFNPMDLVSVTNEESIDEAARIVAGVFRPVGLALTTRGGRPPAGKETP